MTDTIKLAERMSAAELQRIAVDLQKQLGGISEVYINVSRHYPDDPSGIQIYPLGLYGYGDDQHLHAPTWAGVIEQAREWIETNKVVSRNNTIRRMALALISLKDEHGECRRRDLIRQFSTAEVYAFEAEAIARANEMAGGAPFEIVP